MSNEKQNELSRLPAGDAGQGPVWDRCRACGTPISQSKHGEWVHEDSEQRSCERAVYVGPPEQEGDGDGIVQESSDRRSHHLGPGDSVSAAPPVASAPAGVEPPSPEAERKAFEKWWMGHVAQAGDLTLTDPYYAAHVAWQARAALSQSPQVHDAKCELAVSDDAPTCYCEQRQSPQPSGGEK